MRGSTVNQMRLLFYEGALVNQRPCLTVIPSQGLESSPDWMGTEHVPLTGFSWRGGIDRETTGILMWSKPFVVTLPTTGEEVCCVPKYTYNDHVHVIASVVLYVYLLSLSPHSLSFSDILDCNSSTGHAGCV